MFIFNFGFDNCLRIYLNRWKYHCVFLFNKQLYKDNYIFNGTTERCCTYTDYFFGVPLILEIQIDKQQVVDYQKPLS